MFRPQSKQLCFDTASVMLGHKLTFVRPLYLASRRFGLIQAFLRAAGFGRPDKTPEQDALIMKECDIAFQEIVATGSADELPGPALPRELR